MLQGCWGRPCWHQTPVPDPAASLWVRWDPRPSHWRDWSHRAGSPAPLTSLGTPGAIKRQVLVLDSPCPSFRLLAMISQEHPATSGLVYLHSVEGDQKAKPVSKTIRGKNGATRSDCRSCQGRWIHCHQGKSVMTTKPLGEEEAGGGETRSRGPLGEFSTLRLISLARDIFLLQNSQQSFSTSLQG